MNKRLFFIQFITLTACGLHAQTTLIDWGGTEMATADTNFSLPTPTDDAPNGIRTWEYSATTAVVATGGNYTGPNIYGALQTTNATDGPTDFTNLLVDDRGANPDYIVSNLNSPTNGDIVRGFVFFQKTDFLTGPSANITFGTGSSAAIGVVGNTGAGSNRGVRLAVLDGSSWYVSNANFGGFSGTLNIADLSAENFASYDPTGAPMDGIPSPFNIAGSTFTDVQALGYFFNLGTASAGSAGMNISGFEVTGVVPEPSTYALLAGLLGFTWVMLRRRT